MSQNLYCLANHVLTALSKICPTPGLVGIPLFLPDFPSINIALRDKALVSCWVGIYGPSRSSNLCTDWILKAFRKHSNRPSFLGLGCSLVGHLPKSMRYFRALEKAFTGRRPSIFTQYQPRNLQICIRYNSSLASQNSRGLFAQLDIGGRLLMEG